MSTNEEEKEQRILSIQSHVVYGYVGNKAAVFPLQLLGYDVDIINSVHFSNHTGYESGGIKGTILQGKELQDVLLGLQNNHLLSSIQHILTGYIGSTSFLETVVEVVNVIRKERTSDSGYCRYVCDPVLGDHGEFYVPDKALVHVYRDKVLPIADVVTPNQFEVEQLTGIQIISMNDALKACTVLHDMMVKSSLVFITSIVFEDDDDDKKMMTMLASQRVKMDNDTTEDKVWKIQTPILEGSYTGTGDLTAALLLGHTAKNKKNNNDDIKSALEKVVSTMYVVIQRTQQYAMAKKKASSSGSSISNVVADKELRLIQSKKDIENPKILFQAERVK